MNEMQEKLKSRYSSRYINVTPELLAERCVVLGPTSKGDIVKLIFGDNPDVTIDFARPISFDKAMRDNQVDPNGYVWVYDKEHPCGGPLNLAEELMKRQFGLE
jgi:hypothetical protein